MFSGVAGLFSRRPGILLGRQKRTAESENGRREEEEKGRKLKA
jgi:hypothetical protein